jgi:hypothetical protein
MSLHSIRDPLCEASAEKRCLEMRLERGLPANGPRFWRLIDPALGRACKIEVAIDTLDHALAAQRSQPCIDGRAERHRTPRMRYRRAPARRIRCRQGGSRLAHQFRIGARGTCWRLALRRSDRLPACTKPRGRYLIAADGPLTAVSLASNETAVPNQKGIFGLSSRQNCEEMSASAFLVGPISPGRGMCADVNP